MLISDSMPLLWLIYLLLSLVVLVTGHMGIRFLPRLPRWVLTGIVAGLMWMPAYYTLPISEQGDNHTGWAPAIVVTMVAKLQHQGAAGVIFLLLVGAGIGAFLGMVIWRGGRPAKISPRQSGEPSTSTQGATLKRSRREPVVG